MGKITVLLSIILACSVNVLYSQENSGAGSEQAPWFYYWPQEDADNFELSTMDSSSFEPTERSSSLNRGTGDRRSNQEVNRPRQENPDTETDTSAVDKYIAEVEAANKQGSTGNQGSSNIYKWVDSNGEVHVTNNPDSIPPEYRDQATAR